MKDLFKNAAQVASKSLDNKGFTKLSTVVAAGILGVFGILPRAEESFSDKSEFTDADSDKVTETIEHVSKAQEDDFVLADDAPSVQTNTEEDEVEEIEEAEEVEEVELDDVQDLVSEEITEATQATQQATEQVQETQTQPAQNNAGQLERDTEARRAKAARQEEEAQNRAAEAARIAAEEIERIAEEEAARQAEQAQQIEASHNQPNVLLRNGSVVAEGTGRVWYYNGPVDGLSYTDNSGNEKSGNVNSVQVNFDFVGSDGINYSAYTNGRMVPIVIKQTDRGYILHMLGR